MRQVLTTLFLLLTAHFLQAQVKLENHTSEKIQVCIGYYSFYQSTWIVEGWYNVEPYEKLSLNQGTKNNTYYAYAQSDDRKWIGNDKAMCVSNQAFKKPYDQCSLDKERRAFKKYIVGSDRTIHFWSSNAVEKPVFGSWSKEEAALGLGVLFLFGELMFGGDNYEDTYTSCHRCGGDGLDYDNYGNPQDCSRCSGKGYY